MYISQFIITYILFFDIYILRVRGGTLPLQREREGEKGNKWKCRPSEL